MMQNAALLWHVSLLVAPERKGLALGLVGLVRVVPIVVFSMVSGVVADAWNRRRLMLVHADRRRVVALALALLAFRGMTRGLADLRAGGARRRGRRLRPAGAAGAGADARAARASAERDQLNTIMFQTASVVGPGARRLRHRRDGRRLGVCRQRRLVRLRDSGAAADARRAGARSRARTATRDDVSLRAALEGLRFVFRSPLIRSTMLLDFFATFFSSATALLPIFAQDILHVGASGYGWLFAAPAVGRVRDERGDGAADRPHRAARPELLWAVAVYGAGDHGVRLLAFVLADVRLSGADRRDRHGEHRHPQHRPPARDAGPAARADDRREHGVLHGRPAARRARGRRGRELARRAVLGRQRRHRLPDRHRVGGGGDACAAALQERRGRLPRYREAIHRRLDRDTHGLVRPEIAAAFARVDLILHAGDVGGNDVLDALSAIAPVEAVYGNVDDPHDPALAKERVVTVGAITIHVSHGHELGEADARTCARALFRRRGRVRAYTSGSDAPDPDGTARGEPRRSGSAPLRFEAERCPRRHRRSNAPGRHDRARLKSRSAWRRRYFQKPTTEAIRALEPNTNTLVPPPRT